MFQLYEHNRIAYESAMEMLQETGKAAVVHPTGTGKSFIGCFTGPERCNGRPASQGSGVRWKRRTGLHVWRK